MSHVIVTRFAVPRPEGNTASAFRDPDWLAERHGLFRRFFVPSVARLGIPVKLLCGREVAGAVAERVSDLPWAEVVEQDDWRGGWTGSVEQTVTRLDSDDAVHPDWFDAVHRAPAAAPASITGRSLRLDLASGHLQHYRRREPAPLAAFRRGANPYAVDHKHLARLPGIHWIRGPHLLQVVHGGNVSNRRPKRWRVDRWASRTRLAEFGLADPVAG
ncbi:MAG: hypothetical protein AAF481_16120 [Acidobacteriota bacterium]